MISTGREMSLAFGNKDLALASESRYRARLIAFYLPQYHPIPENDEWWGPGFTEWRNVARARPLFRGHYQPRVPADLGYYDLRVPETRSAQAEMAAQHGIEGFCYWHYWFDGRCLLERPFNAVLYSGEPRFPFCLAWANQTWSGVWHGAPDRVLIKQTYPGLDDHERHFNWLLRAFADERYISVGGRPLFVLYRPWELPDAKRVTDLWRELAHRAGLRGLYLAGLMQTGQDWKASENGFDAAIISNETKIISVSAKGRLLKLGRELLPGRDPVASFFNNVLFQPVHVYDYKAVLPYLLAAGPGGEKTFPCIIPNWDNTPRSSLRGMVLKDATPELFGTLVHDAIRCVAHQPPEERLIFVKSWNEWAEGNYLEPDMLYGKRYLQVIQEENCGS